MITLDDLNELAHLVKSWKATKYTGDLTQAVYHICAEELDDALGRLIVKVESAPGAKLTGRAARLQEYIGKSVEGRGKRENSQSTSN